MAKLPRRTLPAGVVALALLGKAASAEPISPIMAAASRLKKLDDQHEQLELAGRGEEAAEISEQECAIADYLTDASPEGPRDAVILLMVAVAEMHGNNFYDDGSHGHERGEIMVRRVMHFLANMVGIDLSQCGGAFFLPSQETEASALTGTVAEAALRFNRVDGAEAARRREEYNAMVQHQLLRARIERLRQAARVAA